MAKIHFRLISGIFLVVSFSIAPLHASNQKTTKLNCTEALQVLAELKGKHVNISDSWRDAETARQRFRAIAEHQNSIRRPLNLSLIELLKGNIEVSASRSGGASIFFDPEGDYSEASRVFSIVGESAMRKLNNDIFGLNYVYTFRGKELMKMEPYSVWYLNQRKSETIELFRDMSAEESDLWQNQSFSKVGGEWGFGETRDGKIPKVVHFSTSSAFTSAGTKSAQIKIKISKTLLLLLVRKQALWAAVIDDFSELTDEATRTSEFILTAKDLDHYINTGDITYSFERFPIR